MSKGYLVLDLAAFYGGGTYLPGAPLARADKATLELRRATTLLEHLRAGAGLDIQNVRSNPSDPPDILFDLNGTVVGVELVQLLPENRLAKDHQLAALRERILDRLPIGELTRDWVINVFLVNDYASTLSLPRNADELLSRAVAEFLRQQEHSGGERQLVVPDSLRKAIGRLTATHCKLPEADPRLRNPVAPLIIFGAQATNIVPDEDFPKLLESCVLPKMQQDLAGPTWLLMWSNHSSLRPMRDEMVSHLERWLAPFAGKYGRLFYLADHALGTLTEFGVPRSFLVTTAGKDA